MTRLMKFALVVTVVTLIVAGGVAVWWWGRGPDVSQFVALREPRLTRMADQRMLVVEATGDPNVVAGAAFRLLFKTYFTLHGVSRAGRQPAPRARWTFSADTPRKEWRGRYALPVPQAVSDLPEKVAGPMPIVITTWAYGDVAEMLHVGSYSTEQPDIERLRAFIESQGYRVVGDHEEEYVKGPGMIFAGDPDTYLTIIRLRVKKGSDTSH
jgi:effector-binding domain-containing protein